MTIFSAKKAFLKKKVLGVTVSIVTLMMILLFYCKIADKLRIGNGFDIFHRAVFEVEYFIDTIVNLNDKNEVVKVDYSYNGDITNESRFIAIGFDDFRTSDFSLILPLLNEYGAKATFNVVTNNYKLMPKDLEKIETVTKKWK